MDRRLFLRYTAASFSAVSAGLSLKSHATPIINNPNTIILDPQTDDISIDLQMAFEQAYLQWLNDLEKRRPVISIPAGTYYIDDIPNNHRGNYPFHMPPTFKLVGAGQSDTILKALQTRGSQYRFLMVIPQTRLDILSECPTLDGACISNHLPVVGPSDNVEIAGIAFENFDNAINLRDAQNCHLHHCSFKSSLVAIQLVSGDRFGNEGHKIEHCNFDAKSQSGIESRFCLRFEAPFSTVWTTTETGVLSSSECEALGGDARDFNASAQTCIAPDDDELNHYLLSLFGQTNNDDITNKLCVIENCSFYNASYSGIEFAGKLNVKNLVNYCSFYQCSGTAIELDKGASFNKVSYNLISGMKPTTAFSPEIPYIFQAAIQEQEGSLSSDRRLKSLISEKGYDDPNNVDYLGADIFYRAASLPQGNEISHNQFDVSRSYWIGQYETDPSRAAYLPDTYSSIKLRKSLDTKVFNNIEFIGTPENEVTYDGVMGHSIVMFPDDELRDLRGGVEIRENQFFGALFVVGSSTAPPMNRPFVIDNNDFGLNANNPRGGLSWNYCIADEVTLSNNRFLCAKNSSSCVMQKLDINQFNITENLFTLPSSNGFYLRSLTALGARSNVTNVQRNTITGGLYVAIYDWLNGHGPQVSNDSLNFEQNVIENLSGSSKVVAVTLWHKNVEINNNRFENLDDKIYQLYSLSDNFSHDGNNSLILGSNSQDKAYSRNYLSTSGSYITQDFWS